MAVKDVKEAILIRTKRKVISWQEFDLFRDGLEDVIIVAKPEDDIPAVISMRCIVFNL